MAPEPMALWKLLIAAALEDSETSSPGEEMLVKRISVRVSAPSYDNVIDTIAAADVECLKNRHGKWWVIGNRKHIRTGTRSSVAGGLSDKAILGGLLVCLCQSMPLNRIIVTPPLGFEDPDRWALKMQALGFRKLTVAENDEIPSRVQQKNMTNETLEQFPLYCPDEQKRSGLIVTAEAFLSQVVIQDPQREMAHETKSGKAASRVRKLLRAYQKKKTVEFEIVLIDQTWPLGDVGAFLLNLTGDIDGICARMTCCVDGEHLPTGRGRAYHVRGTDENGDWWVLGDPMVIHLARKNGLHQKLMAGRVVHCLLNDAAPNRIVWAPGRYAYKGPGTRIPSNETT